jgi:hypothetical protein
MGRIGGQISKAQKFKLCDTRGSQHAANVRPRLDTTLRRVNNTLPTDTGHEADVP